MFWITFTGIYMTFALYFFLRLVYPLSVRWQVKCVIFLFILIPLFLRFTPDEALFPFPDALMLVPSWGFLCVILGASLALVCDIVRLILYMCRVRVPWARCFPVILCIAGCLSVYGMYEGLKVPSLTRYTLSFPNLPQALDGKVIGLVADPQITRFFRGSWLQEGLEKLMAAQPDIIVIAGDAVDAPFHLLQEEAKAFEMLRAPMGVYYVPGNHEYYAGYGPWRRYFRNLPHVTVLENAHKSLSFENDALHIIGITDPVAARFDFEGPDVDKATRGLKDALGDNFRLFLTHRPYHEDYARVGADLILAGHTHGGVMLPIKPLVASKNGGYVSGLYETAFGTLFVSNGMGLWDGFLMRLGVPSEIPLITLRRAARGCF